MGVSLTIRRVLSIVSECADNEQVSQQLQYILHSARHRRGSRDRGGGRRCAWQGTHIPWASRIKRYDRGALPTHLMARAFLFLHLTIYNPETSHSQQDDTSPLRQCSHWFKLVLRHFVSTTLQALKWSNAYPSALQLRGLPHFVTSHLVREGAPQRQDSNLRTESNIWSQVPEWARHLDILTDCQS
jgi:hypothetical protein